MALQINDSGIPQRDLRIHYVKWSALILVSYLLLFRFSYLDDNLFFKWSEIFKNVDTAEIFLLLTLAIALSYVLSNTKFKINDGRSKPLLIFLCAFLLGAIFWSVPETNPDMGRYFFEAKYLEVYGIHTFIHDWGTKLDVLSDFPAVPFIYGLIFKLVGESKFYIQIFTTALFALTGVLTYLIGKKLWTESIGLYAALFLLSFPYLLVKTQLTLISVPLMFFLTAAIYATLNALEAPSRHGTTRTTWAWTAISVILIVLTFLTKASAILMLMTIPVIFLISHMKTNARTDSRTVISRIAIITLLSGVLILTFVIYKLDVLIDMYGVISAFKQRQVSFNESTSSLLFFQISPLVTLMAAYSIYIMLRIRDKMDKRNINYILLLAWVLIPLTFLYDTRIRYLVPLLPAIAIMASIGLNEIKTEKIKKFAASGIILCSLVIAVFFYLPFTHTYSSINVKNAAEYTNALDTDIELYPVFPTDYRYNLNILIPFFDIYAKNTVKTPAYRPVPTAHPDARTTWAWTWVYRDPPPYYPREPDPGNTIVIISPGIEPELPGKLETRLKERYTLEKIYTAGDTSTVRPYVASVYLPKPWIEVKSPKGNETLKAGTTFNVTWELKSIRKVYPAFIVNVYSPSKGIYQAIYGTTNNSYTWKIDPGMFPPADDYKIRIQGTDNNWRTYYFADSGNFSIEDKR